MTDYEDDLSVINSKDDLAFEEDSILYDRNVTDGHKDGNNIKVDDLEYPLLEVLLS